MTLGERIAAARNRAGLTQLQLAQELGLPLFQVADWERGAAEPSLEQMAALCRVLDVTSDYLCWARSRRAPSPSAPAAAGCWNRGPTSVPTAGRTRWRTVGILTAWCSINRPPTKRPR